MGFEKMLAGLRGERDLIDKVIITIENLARKGKRGPCRLKRRSRRANRLRA
jgi:hypothetical protein